MNASKQFKPSQISRFDKRCYQEIRRNVQRFLQHSAKHLDRKSLRLLDIAPQIHAGAAGSFRLARIDTLDVDPHSKAKYIGDITRRNRRLTSRSYDVVVCTEVLEHTLNPFRAIQEIYRILKPGGTLLLSTPYNFRIHGPLPDCWRFTEHGLRELLKGYAHVDIQPLVTPGRVLMPMHYTTVAKK